MPYQLDDVSSRDTEGEVLNVKLVHSMCVNIITFLLASITEDQTLDKVPHPLI